LINTQRTNHGDNITLKARVFFALKSGISCTNPYLITHDSAKSEPVERKTSPPKVQKVNRFTIYSHLTSFYYSYLYYSYLSGSKGRKSTSNTLRVLPRLSLLTTAKDAPNHYFQEKFGVEKWKQPKILQHL